MSFKKAITSNDQFTFSRIHWGLSANLKTSNKSVWSKVFWYVKNIYFQSAIDRLYIETKPKCKKNFFWTKCRLQKMHSFFFCELQLITVSLIICNSYKMHSFFFCELQLITVSLIICNSYTSWSTWFIYVKLCEGFSISDPVLFLLNFIFLFNKKLRHFDFKK